MTRLTDKLKADTEGACTTAEALCKALTTLDTALAVIEALEAEHERSGQKCGVGYTDEVEGYIYEQHCAVCGGQWIEGFPPVHVNDCEWEESETAITAALGDKT